MASETKTILLVEDEATNRKLVRVVLGRQDGYRILEAESVREALARLAEVKPDLVLLDIRLGDGSGLDVVRAMRADRRFDHVPAVALTAQAMKDDEARFLAEGFDGYLSKPVDTRRLPELVERYLRAGRRGRMSDRSGADGASILVVDDSPPNVKLLRVILSAAGYRVVEAASGPEALQVLHRERPDAMVLDVRMPGMTGYEVCAQVRKDAEFAALPAIMLTALSLPEERIRGIEAGATDFISKPFNKKELLARVRASLALAGADRHAVAAQLPGAMLIADPAWKILAISPAANALLGLPPSQSGEIDFTRYLAEPEAGALAAGRELSRFRLSLRVPIDASHVAIRDAGGSLLMRVVTLAQAEG